MTEGTVPSVILFNWGQLMHEYGVTQSIIDTVVEEAEKNNAKKIKFITLVIGELSSIVDDSVQMYFDVLSQGTLAQGAQLVFRRIKAELLCRQCGKTFELEKGSYDCPYCGGLGRLTEIGKEFYIESIEVE